MLRRCPGCKQNSTRPRPKSTTGAKLLTRAELKQVRAEGERDTAQAAARSDAEAKDALLTELKAMLADARRPWLVRVLAAIRR